MKSEARICAAHFICRSNRCFAVARRDPSRFLALVIGFSFQGPRGSCAPRWALRLFPEGALTLFRSPGVSIGFFLFFVSTFFVSLQGVAWCVAVGPALVHFKRGGCPPDVETELPRGAGFNMCHKRWLAFRLPTENRARAARTLLAGQLRESSVYNLMSLLANFCHSFLSVDFLPMGDSIVEGATYYCAAVRRQGGAQQRRVVAQKSQAITKL